MKLKCIHKEEHITKTRLFKYIEIFTIKRAESFKIKIFDIFLISAQNIGGSNEYPQSTVLRRNKKNNVYPCKP